MHNKSLRNDKLNLSVTDPSMELFARKSTAPVPIHIQESKSWRDGVEGASGSHCRPLTTHALPMMELEDWQNAIQSPLVVVKCINIMFPDQLQEQEQEQEEQHQHSRVC